MFNFVIRLRGLRNQLRIKTHVDLCDLWRGVVRGVEGLSGDTATPLEDGDQLEITPG